MPVVFLIAPLNLCDGALISYFDYWSHVNLYGFSFAFLLVLLERFVILFVLDRLAHTFIDSSWTLWYLSLRCNGDATVSKVFAMGLTMMKL